jgi:hypothetical protein
MVTTSIDMVAGTAAIAATMVALPIMKRIEFLLKCFHSYIPRKAIQNNSMSLYLLQLLLVDVA